MAATAPSRVHMPVPVQVLATSDTQILVEGKLQDYRLLTSARTAWRICALLPSARDNYWWGVSWALSEQARLLGVELGIYFANSYADLDQQRQQWRNCEALGSQAFIVAAVNAEGLNEEIKRANKQAQPVVEMINSLSASTTANATVNFANLADLLVSSMTTAKQGHEGLPVVAWFPGPADAANVNDAEARLRELLAGRFSLRFGGYGPPDARMQATLVRDYIERFGVPDFIIGNAAAAAFAVRLFERRQGPRPTILALGVSHEVLHYIRDGSIAAAATDQPLRHARLALDLAVRALEKSVFARSLESPAMLLTRKTLEQAPIPDLLAPPGQWKVQQPLRALKPRPAEGPVERSADPQP
ncbi:TMAO reductase system periplasmic protein TorT [Roseateles oligotrophus]|nr:TMAO reductase system periplasmic protein TorT [Roseateles oligotrophus]